MKPSLIEAARAKLHHQLASQNALSLGAQGIPSIADSGSKPSIRLSSRLFKVLGIINRTKKLPGQEAGRILEEACEIFLRETFLSLRHLRPGTWEVERLKARNSSGITVFEQYQHLAKIAALCATDKDLATDLGQDYLISPDIVIHRQPETDGAINRNTCLVNDSFSKNTSLRLANNKVPLLHASISCKFTIRSDRAQNSRSEALNLMRNRKGRVPHIVVVTSEPLPNRLASIALGTGDIDCIYHIALSELVKSAELEKMDEAAESLQIMIQGKRLRDISDLPLDLAI